MIVCVCKRVSEQTIASHVHMGKDFDDIQFDLQIATQCGRCEECARAVVDRCRGCLAAAANDAVMLASPCHHGERQHAHA